MSSGRVELARHELNGLSDTPLTELRHDHVDFVFQACNLMPTLTVAQNVELSLRLAGRRAERGRPSRSSNASASATASSTARSSSPGASASAWRSPAR